jgi:hypothetical protein
MASAAGASAAAAAAAAAQPAALPPRAPAVSSTPYHLLHGEFTAYLLRNHDDGRAAQEAMYQKLERAGYAAGKRFVERLTRERGERLVGALEVMKFVCREFWSEAFAKAVDKLQTNNKGTFVLQDFNFRPLRHLSAPAEGGPGGGGGGGGDTKQHALKYVVGPCGMIRGALAGLGVECSVNADVSALPRVVFQLRLKEPAGA